MEHLFHLKAAKLQGCTSLTLFLKGDVLKLQSTMRPPLEAEFFPYLCQNQQRSYKISLGGLRGAKGCQLQVCNHIFQNKRL